MADDVEVVGPAAGYEPVLDRFPMRDEDGDIRPEFVEKVSDAIKAADAPFLREIVAELHEADLGDLIGALLSPIEMEAANTRCRCDEQQNHNVANNIAFQRMVPADLDEWPREID